MDQLFGFMAFIGCGFFLFGTMQLVINRFRPVGEPKNSRPIATTATGIARIFQNLALPTMIVAGVVAVIGGIGLLIVHM